MGLASALAAAQDAPPTPPPDAPHETNVAEVRWGSEVRGDGQPFHALYGVAAATDGTPAFVLFGSSPRGLIGGAITVRLVEPMRIRAVALTQAGNAGQFDRASEAEVAVDGRVVARLKLSDDTKTRQRFPLEAAGREVRFTVTSQYDAKDSDVGGWQEVEVLTDEDLAAKFAAPETCRPAGRPLLPPPAEPIRILGQPAKARNQRWTFWSAADLAAIRRQAGEDPEVRDALDGLMRRAESLADARPEIPPPEANLSAESTLKHLAAADAAVDLGLAFALGDDERWARAGIDILARYAASLADYPVTGASAATYSRIFDRRETLAEWTVRLAVAYDLLEPAMSARQRETISRSLLREAATCVAGEESFWADRDLTSLSATAAVLAVGYALADQQLIGWGLQGRGGRGGALAAIERDIGPDGRWLDASPSESLLAAEWLVIMAECAWNNGVNLYAHADGRLKKLLDAPPALAYPTGVLPAVDRGGGNSILGPGLAVYATAARRYADARYRLLAAGATPTMGSRPGSPLPWPWPAAESAASEMSRQEDQGWLEASGLVTLGTGRGARRNQLLMILGATGMERRVDALGLDLFGLGRPLWPSPGAEYLDSYRYENWYRTTVAHNTLTVDERRQAPARAEVSVLAATEDVALVRARTAEAYPGVTIDRTVILTRDYALDLVAAFSRQKHEYDLAYHGFGTLAVSLPTEARSSSISDRPGYFEMADVARGATADAWQATWHDDAGGPAAVMSVPAGEFTDVITATGWMGNMDVPLVIQRRTARETAFASVINLNPNEQIVAAVTWLETESPSARAVRIDTRRGTDYVLVNYAPGVREVGPVRTDARVVVVRTRKHLSDELLRGEVEGLYLAGGSFVEAFGNRLSSSREAVLALERMGAEALLLRNLAGATTEAQATGLRLVRTSGDRPEGYVSHPVDSLGRAPDRVKLSAIADPVQERVAPGTGLAIRREGDTFLEDRATYEQARFGIALRQAHAARLAALEQALAAEDEAKTNPVTPGTVAIAEAEYFTDQGGGNVEITDRKIGCRGDKAFLRWDERGHWLEWSIEAPENGYYAIVLKCCSRERQARRRMEIDGQVMHDALADFPLPYTGGWSALKDDWRLVRLEDYRTGRPVLVYLTAGLHTVRLENLGQSVNLDYLAITSPDVPLERKRFE